jgi:uncharacterized membrane protein
MTSALRKARPAALATGIALLGVLLAAYLTWVHYNSDALVCGLGDCHAVQASTYATLGPVPVAALGLVMYLTVLACNLLAPAKPELVIPATFVAFAAALAGSIYAVYLTWLEVAVIDAICQWCIASATLTLLLATVEGIAVWRIIASPVEVTIETDSRSTASLNENLLGRGTSGAGPKRAVDGKIST